MKKVILSGVIALLAIAIVSCGKYEDGPSMSLLTKKQRLTGDWTLESYTSDGQDITTTIQTLWGAAEWQIEKDEKYHLTGNLNQNGTWELGEDKDDIFMTPDTGSRITYRILRLKNKELWLRYTNPNGTYDIAKFKQ